MSIRKFATAAALMAGVLVAGAAQARPDVQWQVTVETPTIRLPGHVVLPLPPIPVPRAVVVAPQREERWRGTPRWDVDGDGIPNRYDRRPYDPRNGHHGYYHHDRERYDRDDRRGRDDRRDWRDDRRGWDNRRDWGDRRGRD